MIDTKKSGVKRWRIVGDDGDEPQEQLESRQAIEEELHDYGHAAAVEILASVVGFYGYTMVKL